MWREEEEIEIDIPDEDYYSEGEVDTYFPEDQEIVPREVFDTGVMTSGMVGEGITTGRINEQTSDSERRTIIQSQIPPDEKVDILMGLIDEVFLSKIQIYDISLVILATQFYESNPSDPKQFFNTALVKGRTLDEPEKITLYKYIRYMEEVLK